jgi:hypothetical protein
MSGALRHLVIRPSLPAAVVLVCHHIYCRRHDHISVGAPAGGQGVHRLDTDLLLGCHGRKRSGVAVLPPAVRPRWHRRSVPLTLACALFAPLVFLGGFWAALVCAPLSGTRYRRSRVDHSGRGRVNGVARKALLPRLLGFRWVTCLRTTAGKRSCLARLVGETSRRAVTPFALGLHCGRSSSYPTSSAAER